MLKVIKRNGRKVNFNKSKIEQAILKAYKVLYDEQDDEESGKQLAKRISNEIEKLVVDEISVEDIQDLVEKKLMSSSYKDVAKIYIKYRYLKSMARTQYDELWEAVDERLKAKKGSRRLHAAQAQEH